MNKKNDFTQNVVLKLQRKQRARHHDSTNVIWFGLGMMGLVGWSIVVPTLLGAILGSWLDKYHPGEHPWTLALIVAGLSIGCVNAWLWVDREDKKMREIEGDHNE